MMSPTQLMAREAPPHRPTSPEMDPKPVRFRVLGPLRIDRGDDSAIALGGPRQRAVLALLLVNANRPLSCDQMVEALWGEEAPATAVPTLHAYISNLRRVIEPGSEARQRSTILQKNGGGYQVTVACSQLDALEAEHLIEQSRALLDQDPAQALELVDRALALWNGPPFADFQYHDFAQFEIARLDELRTSARELKITAGLAIGESARLIPDAEAIVQSHPFREQAWSQLMTALYRAGRQVEALDAYRRCESSLAEVGLVPSEALRHLELAVLRQDPALDRSSQTGLAPPPQAFVGRRHERNLLLRALHRSLTGTASAVLLSGEPGVGKTHLLEVVRTDAVTLGFRNVYVRCAALEGAPPLWPWVQLVRRLGPTAIRDAAGGYAAQLEPLMPGGDPNALATVGLFRTAEALAEALEALGALQPLLIVIDELLPEDHESLALLAFLSLELGNARVAIVCSSRATPGSCPGLRTAPSDGPHLMGQVLSVTLARLDRTEIGDLLEAVGGLRLTTDVIDSIFDRSEGHPLMAIQIAQSLQDGSSAIALDHR